MSARLPNGLAIMALLIVAAIPRFYDLGSPGFYGDEETTAHPARAFLETGKPNMPSGMPYHRALPLTWLNAASASLFGVDNELSYRVPAAVLGTLMAPLLFFAARPFVGFSVALTASLLLALSEWHIVTSREARMYVPFLFFYFGAAMAALRWAKTGLTRYLSVAAALFAVTVSLHQLAAIGTLVALTPIAFAGWARVRPWLILVVSLVAGAAAWTYGRLVIVPAFTSWMPVQQERQAARPLEFASWLTESFAMSEFWVLTLVAVGVALGGLVARRADSADASQGSALRRLARYGAAMLAGALACIGQLYGSALATLVFLYIGSQGPLTAFRKAALPVMAVAAIATIVSGITLVKLGVVEGAKTLLGFPYPYVVQFAEMFPLVFLLFAGGLVSLAVGAHRTETQTNRILALAAILPIAAIGVVSRWGGMRYLFEVYPFLLLTAAAALLGVLQILGAKFRGGNDNFVVAVALVIVASGVLGGHGIPQAYHATRVSEGSNIDELTYGYPVYPDHKSTGEFVRSRLSPSDLVIAEDPLQQRWYAGRVDYWFRNPLNIRPYLYSALDGTRRDIYVNSRPITSIDMLDELVGSDRNNKVWFITSGETYPKRELYLDDDQRDWLRNLESVCEPDFVGKDDISSVYCLTCCENAGRSPEQSQ